MSDDARHDRWPDEIAAYVLGALDSEEAAEVEHHLETCERCQAGLRWAIPALNALPEAVEQVEPPPTLRARLLAEAERDAASEAKAEGAGAERRRDRRFTEWLRGPASRPLVLRPAFGFLVLALAVVAVAGYEIGSGDSGESAGPGTTIVAGKAPGVVARVTHDGEDGTLRLSNVAPLHDDRVLEAWVQRGERVMPVRALFVPDHEGRASTTLPHMEGVSAVMVTVEPRGGSEAPTSQPIATVPIPVESSAG
jgi:anti-sigma-K factor RskA